MIVKVIKSYRDTEMDSVLVPRSKDKVKVLLEVEEDRGNILIKSGVAEEYIIENSEKEVINVLEAEPTIEVEETVVEDVSAEKTPVEEVKEDKTETKGKNKNDSKKNK